MIAKIRNDKQFTWIENTSQFLTWGSGEPEQSIIIKCFFLQLNIIWRIDGKQTKGCDFFIFYMTKTNWTADKIDTTISFFKEFKHFGSLLFLYWVKYKSISSRYVKKTQKKSNLMLIYICTIQSFDSHSLITKEEKSNHIDFSIYVHVRVFLIERKTIDLFDCRLILTTYNNIVPQISRNVSEIAAKWK